jgi:ubiquinone/menaquinone biosynthesis C-methylase UbiE
MDYENKKENNNTKGLEMYFSQEITEKFAELEQNEKNFRVANIVDNILIQEINNFKFPIYSAELGGGAHPDRYDKFFNRLLKDGGHIDWVDVSPYMLKLADKYISNEKYQDRKDVITFIESDILEYLQKLEKEKLDIAIMKYTIDHIKDLDELFKLLSEKLKPGAKLVSTIGSTNPELKSYSTNARFLYNGEEFSNDEVKILKDGDNFTIKFFKVSGNPNAGYLEGAETLKYYHSAEKIKELANKYNFSIFLGDWKNFVKPENQGGEDMDQEVLVLTKIIN